MRRRRDSDRRWLTWSITDRYGIDHVGLGSEFFEGESCVRFERFFRRRYPAIVGNYTTTIAKVMGGNFLRVHRGSGVTNHSVRMVM
jgi:microsomal dipeptidase-like Zn-dependent dipeptidase